MMTNTLLGRVVRTRYATVGRFQHWNVIDARCETTEPDQYGLTTHYLTFVLLNCHGERLDLGGPIITEHPNGERVHDEDGVFFPDLDTAARAYCAQLLVSTPLPGGWVQHKPRHELWDETEATAF